MAGLRLNGFVRILMKNLYVGMFEIIILYLPEDADKTACKVSGFYILDKNNKTNNNNNRLRIVK